MAHLGGRPLMYETPEELEKAIQAYFDMCIENLKPVTISGLAYHLGFSDRASIYDYKEREQFSHILKRATFFVEHCYETKLSGTAPTGAIFALKNMGWKDKTEAEVYGKDGAPLINIIMPPGE